MSGPDLPDDFGDDITPTQEMVERGAVGHGRGMDYEALAEHNKALMETQKKEKAAQRTAFNQKMTDLLEKVAGLHDSIISASEVLAKRMADGDRLSSAEMQMLKMGQAAAKEVVDRDMGKPKAVTETTTQSTFIGVLLKAAGTLSEADSDVIDVELPEKYLDE